ncbi:SAM-dependent methyltransferase [Actinocorallia longicatena]|uniref:SAM-dependent methyltransferase n=1 Tax=Actinocorallia longicatena TaxID=111803 RepID=A0ABP6QJU5_9ACTN
MSDPHIPSVARMYDYYLGGKDNFAADREVGDRVLAAMPYVRAFTRANRVFLARAVTLAAEDGVRQFLDIGSGLPTQENTHEVAQRNDPDARVVYVDRDPIVITHARALLEGNGQTSVVQGDLLDIRRILDDPGVLERIDFTRPVAVLLLAILHFVARDEDVLEILSVLRSRMVSGSYLVLSHGHAGDVGEELEAEVRSAYEKTSAGDIIPRPYAQVLTYFDGLELVDPGLVPVEFWRAGDSHEDHDLSRAGFLGAVAKVP